MDNWGKQASSVQFYMSYLVRDHAAFTVCNNCRCWGLNFPLASLFLSALMSLGFSGSFFLNNLWDTQLFQLYSRYDTEAFWMWVKREGERIVQEYLNKYKSRLLVSPCRRAVTFTSAHNMVLFLFLLLLLLLYFIFPP